MSELTMPTRRWANDVVEPAAHPAPEVAARLADELEIPRNAARLAALAIEHGWIVRITYARGTWAGRVPKVIDSIVLACRRERARGVGIWHDGAFHSALYLDARTPAQRCNAGELRDHLAVPA